MALGSLRLQVSRMQGRCWTMQGHCSKELALSMRGELHWPNRKMQALRLILDHLKSVKPRRGRRESQSSVFGAYSTIKRTLWLGKSGEGRGRAVTSDESEGDGRGSGKEEDNYQHRQGRQRCHDEDQAGVDLFVWGLERPGDKQNGGVGC